MRHPRGRRLVDTAATTISGFGGVELDVVT